MKPTNLHETQTSSQSQPISDSELALEGTLPQRGFTVTSPSDLIREIEQSIGNSLTRAHDAAVEVIKRSTYPLETSIELSKFWANNNLPIVAEELKSLGKSIYNSDYRYIIEDRMRGYSESDRASVLRRLPSDAKPFVANNCIGIGETIFSVLEHISSQSYIADTARMLNYLNEETPVTHEVLPIGYGGSHIVVSLAPGVTDYQNVLSQFYCECFRFEYSETQAQRVSVVGNISAENVINAFCNDVFLATGAKPSLKTYTISDEGHFTASYAYIEFDEVSKRDLHDGFGEMYFHTEGTSEDNAVVSLAEAIKGYWKEVFSRTR